MALDVMDLMVSVGGSWMTRGHSSLYGIGCDGPHGECWWVLDDPGSVLSMALDVMDLMVSVGGSWMTRGHSSLYGIGCDGPHGECWWVLDDPGS